MGGCFSYRLTLVRDQIPNKDTDLPKNVTRFSYESMKKATNNFSTRVRNNGFSSSYKGNLEGGSKVMIKVYNNDSRPIDFAKMIKIMSGVKHRNVVELIGYCVEDNHMILVHEFVGDYTLDELLFSDSVVGYGALNWPKRVSICHSVARAIEHLHNGISPRVVLRDVKPRNLLMDCNFNPKIVDFEISCLLEDGESSDSDIVCGTFGYLDPQYARTGIYSEKTDVYSFGVTLLEIISGKKNLNMLLEQDHPRLNLLNWAWELREDDRVSEIIDRALSEFSEDEVMRFVNVAFSCTQSCTNDRPSMSEVRLMLSDGYDFSNMVLTRPCPNLQQTSDHEISDIGSDYEV